nr:RNA-directed DNA polymerase, eukaryota [Tanacetum cinerariifolium]
SGTNVPSKDVGVPSIGKSYVHMVKGNNMSGTMECDSIPLIVLDDECLYSKDLSKSLIVWMEIEGIPFKLWSGNTFKRIAAKWGNYWMLMTMKRCVFNRKEVPGWVLDFFDDSDYEDQSDDGFKDGDPKVQDVGICGDDSDVAEVPETLLEESTGKKEKQPEDPFGFTPNDDTNEFCMNEENVRSVNDDNPQNCNVDEVQTGQEGNSANKGSKVDVSKSVCSGHLKKSEALLTGGSILCLLEELVKVGQTMGYNMDGPRLQGQKDWVKELCTKNKVNFLAIQETKMESMELCSVKTCWGNFAFDYVHSDSVGNSGGILCVWDPNSFRRSNITISDYFIMIRGMWLKTGVNLLIVAVYAPHDLRGKRMLWDYLTHVINQWDGKVVTMGDFNDVRYKSDRFGLVFNVQGADVFNSFVANAGLKEVPLGGSSFTCCHKSATKMSKLDRFLISKNLLITCPNISATTLDRYLSDHRPILLRETQSDYGPVPFRFFHHWTKLEGFNKFVIDTWSEAHGDDSNAMRNMMRKLKYLKVKIREWNNGNRNNTKRAIEKYKEELKALDAAIDKGNGFDEIVNKRMEVINSMHHIDKIQVMDMAQKAKIKWPIEGDENSRFFHGVLNKKRSQLNIHDIMVDEVWTEKPNTVKHEVLQHFWRRFDKPTVSRAYVNISYPKSITIDQQIDLERDVSKEELNKVVWDCGMDKSPGPDGFTFGFYRHFWSTIENDVFEAVKHFFTYNDIPKGCNSSFIALILKISDANMVKDFRPISLIGSIYKIIAKILANRLVGVLGDIVNEVQSTFIAERQILDGPFILNEVLQWCKVKKKQSLIFKVDFKKAYDSVRWDFLDDILKKFGFGNKWCAWIQSFLRSSRGSIIINESPTEEFQFFKGLKQGDPLSPFLFILIMESLHLSFQRVVDARMFMGIKLSPSLNLSHMFYADDAVFVGQCVLASKEKGGLGVSSLYALNRGLMLKWVWRFYSQKTSLWARVIKAIYVDDGKVGKVTNAGIRSCRMNIVNEISVLKNQGGCGLWRFQGSSMWLQFGRKERLLECAVHPNNEIDVKSMKMVNNGLIDGVASVVTNRKRGRKT